MLIWDKSDLWIGCEILLSDGRVAEVDQDSENHEMIVVSCDGEEFPVYVGETFDGALYAKSIIPGQSCDPEPEEDPNDYWNYVFDGVDPNTFDGDLLDLIAA